MVQVQPRGAFVTLLTKPNYLSGALVLEYSLRDVGSKYPLVVMVSSDLPKEALDVLAVRGIQTVSIDKLAPKTKDTAIRDERFPDTWCKLAVFQLTQFERVVLLDSDMLVRKNMDELIEMPLDPDWIAADHVCTCNPRKLAHYPKDWIPRNCAYSSPCYPPEITPTSPRTHMLLNSGTVVLTPSPTTFASLTHFLSTSPLVPTFQFPDQDLLAEFFHGRWRPLDYIYNALKTLRVVHSALWRDEDVKCVHYILGDKPWTYRPKTGELPHGEIGELNRWWWDAYYALEKEMGGTEEGRKALEYVELYVAS